MGRVYLNMDVICLNMDSLLKSGHIPRMSRHGNIMARHVLYNEYFVHIWTQIQV